MISSGEIKRVLVRKALHFLIALSPLFASISFDGTVILLASGTVLYAFIESSRISGSAKLTAAVVKIIAFASHSRDEKRYVLGPLTLGAGALISLLIFPREIFAVSVYALAFGDGFAGLVGRAFGRLRPAFLRGKSVEGSAACFSAIFVSSVLVTGRVPASLFCAACGAAVEAFPAEDFDNIILPLVTGAALFFAL